MIVCKTKIYRIRAVTFKDVAYSCEVIINKYYVMNYSINSFTGAGKAPVNVVVVY